MVETTSTTKGIVVPDATAKVDLGETEVSGALNGVRSDLGGVYVVGRCKFYDNYIGIRVTQYVPNHTGTVDGTTFNGFNALVGGSANDDFNFSVTPTTANVTVDGAGLTDVVNLSALAGPVVVQLGASGFSNIESYIGNDTNSTLIGNNQTNSWIISGQNDGTINSVTSFTNFNALTGGAGNDTFSLATGGGSLTGLINGGGGGGADTLDISNTSTATTVRVVDAVPASVTNPANTLTVYQIGTVSGNSAYNHNLIGPDTNATWAINAVNSGSLNYGSTVLFDNFRKIKPKPEND